MIMDFKKRLIEELNLSPIAANTMYADYITACEKIAKEYAQQQVKNCNIAPVVNRRELLLDFADYSESDKTSQTTDECVDNYLDSIK